MSSGWGILLSAIMSPWLLGSGGRICGKIEEVRGREQSNRKSYNKQQYVVMSDTSYWWGT